MNHGEAVRQSGERELGAVTSSDAVEAVHGLLGGIEVAELGVAVEPPVERPTTGVIEREATAKEKASDDGGASVARDEPAAAIDVLREQTQHVKFVADDASVREEAKREGLVRVAEVRASSPAS
jgi:hypothetical protein